MDAAHAERLVHDLDVRLERCDRAAQLAHGAEELGIVACVRLDVASGVGHDDP